MVKISTSTKKEIKTRSVVIDDERLIGSPLKDAIAYLTKLMEENPGKELYMDIDNPWYDQLSIGVNYDEPETDKEFQNRMASIERARAEVERAAKAKATRAKDLKEYKRLQSKLGLF